jgi:glycosyltransferase involved in cell wall biosynthesis
MSTAVLLVGVFRPPSSGSAAVGAALAQRLSERGWRVFTTSGRQSRGGRLADMLATIARRRRSFAVAQVDVFSGAAFVWAEAACAALRLMRRPYVLTLHGGGLPEFGRRNPQRVRRLLASAAAVTAPSAYLKRHVEVWRQDIEVIPNPIDVQLYERKRSGKAGPRALWLRAFHSTYAPEVAVDAIARLSSIDSQLRLTMIGPDKGDGALAEARERTDRQRLGGRVTFAQAVAKTEVPDVLRTHDIFLNTSRIDNAPVTVVEALAAGLCVVTTDVGGIGDLVAQGRDALLVPPDDPAAMAAAVHQVRGNEHLAETLRAGARETARAHDWSVVLPRWERLFQAVAAQSAP